MICKSCPTPLHKYSLQLGHDECGSCRRKNRQLLAYHAKGGYGSLAGQKRLGTHIGHVAAAHIVGAL